MRSSSGFNPTDGPPTGMADRPEMQRRDWGVVGVMTQCLPRGLSDRKLYKSLDEPSRSFVKEPTPIRQWDRGVVGGG